MGGPKNPKAAHADPYGGLPSMVAAAVQTNPL